MGSLGSSSNGVGNKAAAAAGGMWIYPKCVGFNPSERWGHSACYIHGYVYIFGGCNGGLHFSDVLLLNTQTSSWTKLPTIGTSPEPRDSHTSTLYFNKIIIFGGTNGSNKLNDLHILDLSSNQWIHPITKGNPPPPRESHTVTLVGDSKLVVFGGSGEGIRNYLNDLYILDLKRMEWSCPVIKSEYIPDGRDSHVAVGIGNKVYVHGGDSGDKYHGEIDVFDTDNFTWTKLCIIDGCCPGARAGHAAVSIGLNIYITGGVGDKRYYNDVWVLDTSLSLWIKLDICGRIPQGRFSHTAIAAGSDIVIYGGCGEDERPLKELLILHLGSEYPSDGGRYNVPISKGFGIQYWNSDQEKKRLKTRTENNKTMLLGGNIESAEGWLVHEQVSRSNCILPFSSDTLLHPKRRRTIHSSPFEMESEEFAEDLSVSISQQSSSSQSDREQQTTMILKKSASVSPTTSNIAAASPSTLILPLLNQSNQSPRRRHHSTVSSNINPVVAAAGTAATIPMMNDNHSPSSSRLNFTDISSCPEEILSQKPRQCLVESTGVQNLIGAGVEGKVDGAFDSGYLMTATVNGRLFRGVLFAPVVPAAVPCSGTTTLNQKNHSASTSSETKLPHCINPERGLTTCCSNNKRPKLEPLPGGHNTLLESTSKSFGQAKAIRRSVGMPADQVIIGSVDRGSTGNRGNDLQGLALTLGGPGSGHAG